jgi:DNA-binding CsgD family transcriptional regulator
LPVARGHRGERRASRRRDIHENNTLGSFNNNCLSRADMVRDRNTDNIARVGPGRDGWHAGRNRQEYGMFDKLFDDTIGRVEGIVEKRDGDELLKHVKGLYGLSHVAYLCLNLPDAQAGSIYFQGTYSDNWVRFYKTNRLATIDPVAREGLGSIIPLDWDVLRSKHPDSRFVFDEAVNHGIGAHGLTFPVRGVHGEIALFHVTADVTDTEWAHVRRTLIRDMQVFAAHFHNRVLQLNGHETFQLVSTLTPRELDCLRYLASGLNYDGIAGRLKITERTVRFHLENARTKLDCLTTAQALAKAVALGFVFPR